MQDGFSLLNPQGVHLDVNLAFCAMTGFSREELIGAGLPYPYWPPEDQAMLTRNLRRHIDETNDVVEATFVRKSGQRFPVQITPTAVRGEDGQPICIFAVIKDVGAQHDAEQALRGSEARYRGVVENAPVGVFESTLEGQLVYVNHACANTFGCETPEEMIELVNRTGIGPAIYEDPADRRRLLQDVHAAGGAWVAFKDRLHHRGGAVHIGLIYLCERRDSGSGEAHLFGFVQDVTAQEQAAKALERTSALLSHGERLAHVGSWEWDIAAGKSTGSAEWQRMHGLAGDTHSDEEVDSTCHEDDREAVRAALALAAAGEPYRIAHRIVHPKTHEVRHLMTYGDPLLDAEGALKTIIGASLDVTERVLAQEVLLEREERLQRALGGTITALGATVAMRDPYTANHERRVSELACVIADRLDWSQEAIAVLRNAALVHDVGKIAVPAEILSKPTRLNADEFELIKSHPSLAYEILAPIEFDGPVAEVVRQHHERLDGSGYPRGLRGKGGLARRPHPRDRRRRRGDDLAPPLPRRLATEGGARRDRARLARSLRRRGRRDLPQALRGRRLHAARVIGR